MLRAAYGMVCSVDYMVCAVVRGDRTITRRHVWCSPARVCVMCAVGELERCGRVVVMRCDMVMCGGAQQCVVMVQQRV